MIGQEGHLHRWTAPRKKFIQRVENQCFYQKAWLNDCVNFRFYAISVLCFIGPVCAPDKATLKAENHALQCTSAGPYNVSPSTLLGVGSVCGFGPDLVGIHSLNQAARYRVAACSSTLGRGLEKISTARGHKCTLSFSLPFGKKSSMFHPWPLALRVHLKLFVGWTVMTHLTKSHKTKKQKVATGLLLDKLHQKDFAGPLSSRASSVGTDQSLLCF